MKLYATLKNSVNKVEGIGDNELLVIQLNKGNKIIGEIFFDCDGFLVKAGGKEVLDYDLKGKRLKGKWKLAQCGHGIDKDKPCSDCNSDIR